MVRAEHAARVFHVLCVCERVSVCLKSELTVVGVVRVCDERAHVWRFIYRSRFISNQYDVHANIIRSDLHIIYLDTYLCSLRYEMDTIICIYLYVCS